MTRRQQLFPDADPFALGEEALRDLREPLLAWLDAHVTLDAEVDAATVVDALTLSLGGLLALRRPPSTDATRFTPAEVELLVGEVVPAQVAEADPVSPADVDADFRALWFHYFSFLDDTGRWRGSAGDLETCRALLDQPAPDLLRDLEAAAEDVDADEEDAAVLPLLPVRAAVALLAHVGDGLVVPDDEDLARDDVTAVLAGFDHPPLPETGDGQPPAVADVPWLRQVVLDLLALEVLELDEDETLLSPTAAAAAFTDPTPEPRELRRLLVGRFLLDDPDVLEGGFSVAGVLVPNVLAAAVLADPMTRTDLVELVETVAELGPVGETAVDEVVARLGDLAAQGLLDAGEPWTLRRGLWPALAAGVADGTDEELELDLFGEGGLDPLHFDAIADQLGLGEEQRAQVRGVLGGGA